MCVDILCEARSAFSHNIPLSKNRHKGVCVRESAYTKRQSNQLQSLVLYFGQMNSDEKNSSNALSLAKIKKSPS